MKLLLFCAIFGFVQCQLISKPQLDCSRIHSIFCCTTRIRNHCQRECNGVQCGQQVYQKLFSADLNQESTSRDGSAAIHASSRPEEVTVDLAPPPSVPVDISTEHFRSSIPITTTSLPTKYPTLIPFEPSIDDIQSISDKDESQWTTLQPTAVPRTARTTSSRKRTTPDPRIIRPPESLVIIGDYDIEELENVSDQDNIKTAPTVTSWNGPASSSQLTNGQMMIVSNTGGVFLPTSSWNREEFVETEQKLHKSGALGPPDNSLSVSLLRRTSNVKEGVAQIPNFAVDGIASKDRKKFSSNGFPHVINSFNVKPSNPVHNKDTNVVQNTTPSLIQLTRTTSGIVVPPLTHRPFLTPPPPPQPPTVRCGVAPDFRPCVPANVASTELLRCCQAKNMPHGCLQLCRYDITQAEVRAAMDRGQCGILNVQPFLECAAQGHDNTECCTYKGVARKSGPQCEQFCRPSKGITALGLQHIVCGNVIGEMLQCHHSGIRL
ncbi:unnamed protein product [Auanema sp. JU1783]|nr:unnamed protein product [Auanema sp. JU1783]